MSASSYDILKELGALIIWILKGFSYSYSTCRQNKYASEIGLSLVVFVIIIIFITGW
jgi:hypothetical protein